MGLDHSFDGIVDLLKKRNDTCDCSVDELTTSNKSTTKIKNRIPESVLKINVDNYFEEVPQSNIYTTI